VSDKYKVFDGDEVYFVTFTIVEWIKVLEDDDFKLLIINSIKYYQINKGLVVYAYCIMPNHVHMIVQATGESNISEILRDLKKITSRSIVKKLESQKTEGNEAILKKFSDAGKLLKRITNFKVWQDGNRAKLIYSNKFLMEKLNYVHNNPVEYGLCNLPWEYTYSSALNYAEKTSVLDVELLSIW
jgi:REP element-mobilizing transposase RayT